MTNNLPLSPHTRHDCTLAVVRALTKPFIHPPSAGQQLKRALLEPWNVRVPVNPNDNSTRIHWQKQTHSALFRAMFDWDDSTIRDSASSPGATASLHPYFSFGDPNSPFFASWEDVGNCVKQLMLNRIASRHQTGKYIALASQEIDLFLATSHNFQESFDLEQIRLNIQSRVHATSDPSYYLLRCHYDRHNKTLIFGYHSSPANAEEFRIFHRLVEVSLSDEDWRLTTSTILKNLVRILHCLQDFCVPLIWSSKRKLSMVRHANSGSSGSDFCIQKIYKTEHICNIFNATVTNMISVYEMIENANVPHTDRLIAVEQLGTERICKFAPVGRSYLPQNLSELLDALICVAEALCVMHAIGIMHRDIRWANIFHAFQPSCDYEQKLEDSHEWILFDFEYAAKAPQPAFGAQTLTPGNHAPEMVATETDEMRLIEHGIATDIWGLGFLLSSAFVDVPASHASELKKLENDCLNKNPSHRPTAEQCLDLLRNLQKRPSSTEKDVADIL